jgi:hypothetical protein
MNAWEKIYGARRRAIHRKLLASLEREIAQAERIPPRRRKMVPRPALMTKNAFASPAPLAARIDQ